MSSVYIVAGCRTPIGNFQGELKNLSASEMGSVVIAEALKRAGIEPDRVEEVVMGQVLTAGQGQNPGRQAAVKAKIPFEVPAYTLNMLCGSGLKAVCNAYLSVASGQADIVVAGGQESMTRACHTSYVRGNKLGNLNLVDSLLSDGLIDAFNNVHMGVTAETLVDIFKVTREEQDRYSKESQNKAQAAIEKGYFIKEIVPLIKDKKSKELIIKDEFPRFNTTMEGLSKLRTVFKESGTVTAGNASGINDGAAALILCSEKIAKTLNVENLIKIIAISQVGVEPLKMGLGPVGAVEQLLIKAGWTKESVDLYEINEAFAVQALLVLRQLGLELNKVNISGGAIALGHPIGASGARILVTLIHNLHRLNKKRGVAALCIGGGMGIAIAVERV